MITSYIMEGKRHLINHKIQQGKCIGEFSGFLKQVQHTGFEITDHLYPYILHGDPWMFISIYQHLFYEYLECVTTVVARSFPPWTLTDSLEKRVQVAFSIMTDVFGYTPVLKLHQFVERKFSRHKILMCLDVLKLINNQLARMKYKYNSLPRNPLLPRLEFKYKHEPKQKTRLTTSKIDLTRDDVDGSGPKILVKIRSIAAMKPVQSKQPLEAMKNLSTHF